MKTYALPVSIFILAVSLVAIVFLFNTHNAAGSVTFGNEYRFIEVDSSTGTTSPIQRPGSIGSIVVDEDGTAGALYFYATTSSATSSADLIFGFDGAAAETTYTYDISFGGGLLIEERGFDGQAVITYR